MFTNFFPSKIQLRLICFYLTFLDETSNKKFKTSYILKQIHFNNAAQFPTEKTYLKYFRLNLLINKNSFSHK